MLGDSSDKTNFPYRLLNTERQVSKLCIAFANNSSANIKLSETQLPKMVQWRGLEPWPKTVSPLMNNVLKPLTKSVLVSLGLTVAASPTDNTVQKNNGYETIMIISNKETEGTMKIVKSLEEFCLLIKRNNWQWSKLTRKEISQHKIYYIRF